MTASPKMLDLYTVSLLHYVWGHYVVQRQVKYRNRSEQKSLLSIKDDLLYYLTLKHGYLAQLSLNWPALWELRGGTMEENDKDPHANISDNVFGRE